MSGLTLTECDLNADISLRQCATGMMGDDSSIPVRSAVGVGAASVPHLGTVLVLSIVPGEGQGVMALLTPGDYAALVQRMIEQGIALGFLQPEGGVPAVKH